MGLGGVCWVERWVRRCTWGKGRTWKFSHQKRGMGRGAGLLRREGRSRWKGLRARGQQMGVGLGEQTGSWRGTEKELTVSKLVLWNCFHNVYCRLAFLQNVLLMFREDFGSVEVGRLLRWLSWAWGGPRQVATWKPAVPKRHGRNVSPGLSLSSASWDSWSRWAAWAEFWPPPPRPPAS